MELGTVSVLNVHHGHITLSFDKANPEDRIRAARMVRDMLRRGYALLVEVDTPDGKRYQRVHEFHEDACEYVVADFDPEASALSRQDTTMGANDEEKPQQTLRRRGRKRRMPADQARAVAVAPSAGG